MTSELAEQIVADIERDLTDRSGLDLRELVYDTSILAEIHAEWVRLVHARLVDAAVGGNPE